jgi:hypothetical protein
MRPVSRSNTETVSSDSDDNSFPSETADTSFGSDVSSDSTEEQETESDAGDGFDYERNRLQLRLSRANEVSINVLRFCSIVLMEHPSPFVNCILRFGML